MEKLNMNISEDLKGWYKKEAESLGMPMASLIIFALNEYKDKKELTKVSSKSEGMVNAMLEMFKQCKELDDVNNVGYVCHECHKPVPSGVENHFTAEDGRILCDECSVGVKPCSEDIMQKLIKMQISKE